MVLRMWNIKPWAVCGTFMVLLSCMGGGLAQAGAITEALREMCPEQYARYSDVVENKSVRIHNDVESYGCGVVSAYGVFLNTDEDRLKQWEDDRQSFEWVSQIFLFAERHQLDIEAKPILFDVLQALFISEGGNQTDQLDDLLSHTSSRERRQINREPERVLYLIWAMQISKTQTARNILRITDRLMRDFPLEKLPVSMILDGQIATVYPNFSAKKRLTLIKSTFHSYGSSFMMKVITNKQALPNLIYLLPPQSGDISNIQGLTEDDLHRLQRDYVQSMKDIIISFEHATTPFGASVEAASILAPYIQDALQNTDIISITSYLKTQIHSPVFEEYIHQHNNCTEDNFAKVVATFFTFLAPFKSKNEPIAYLQHNLARIATWYHSDANMRAWVMDGRNEPDEFIRNLAWLPYSYEKASSRSKRYVSRLLSDLPGFPNTNASFILALFQNTDYFSWLSYASDADAIVVANEDAGDSSETKFRYILTTPFPSQDDPSIYERFLKGQPGISMVTQLHTYTVEDLSTHAFTKSEKIMSMLGNADTLMTVASVLAVPLTGGASILFIGAKIAAKQTAKKGFKYAMKAGYRYVRKTASRNMHRVGKRLVGKDGGKAFVREIKEVAGYAQKRGRPSAHANIQKTLGNVISKGEKISDISDDIIQQIPLGVMVLGIATGIYCDKYANSHSNSSQIIQGLCHVQGEDSKENICQKFKR